MSTEQWKSETGSGLTIADAIKYKTQETRLLWTAEGASNPMEGVICEISPDNQFVRIGGGFENFWLPIYGLVILSLLEPHALKAARLLGFPQQKIKKQSGKRLTTNEKGDKLRYHKKY